ncbi:MAG: ABC transporter permease [Clostridiales bacterium]|nr:ABC transporter permease [Clostridiales bacterium]
MRFFRDIKKYWRYIIYAGQSELKAEVANSYLNWLWWIIEPLCFMLIYAFVFGTLFGSQIEHIQIFVYIGITMWDFFNRMITSSVTIVRHNKSIVSKVYIPKYMLIFVKMYVNAFKLVIAFILLFFMVIATGVSITWYMLWIVPILLIMFLLSFALGTFLLHFGVYVDDLANVVKIVLRMLFYLTGIFYDLEGRLQNVMSAHMASVIGKINPMAFLINCMRNVVMYGSAPNYKYLLIWTVIGLVLAAGGVRLVYKNENSYVKVI